MKKVLLVLLAIFVSTLLFADFVDVNSAEKVVVMKIQIEGEDNSIESVFTLENDGKILAYIFHLAPQGFVVVSADTEIAPVISYSFGNNYSTEDVQFNNGFQMLKADMKLRWEALPQTSAELKANNSETWEKYQNEDFAAFQTRDETWPPEGYSATAGWVEVQWNQSAPWNAFCPIDPGTNGRSVTGCVATAMSMIMQYHHFAGNPTFSDADDYWSTETSPMIHIDNHAATRDFPTFPELNSYLPEMTEHLSNWETLTNDDMAALNFAAGVSVKMAYSEEGSGAMTMDVDDALLGKFGFDSANFVNNINATFYNNLKSNMQNAQPVFLGIIESGSPYGHAIIVDGYNSNDDTYHFNMGWGGSADGWYSLPNGMPSGFDTITQAVINIEGGFEPFTAGGQVITAGADATDASITLDGPRYYECTPDGNGQFLFDWVVAGWYDCTAIIEMDNGGFEYANQLVWLDENNTNIFFFMDSYEYLTAEISAPINPTGCSVAVYQDEHLVTSGVADASGSVEMVGILPGDYFAVASLDGNYFAFTDYTVSAGTQNMTLNLTHYPYNHNVTFAGEPVGQFQMLGSMSCGIKLFGEDIANYDGEAISKVKFIAPFDAETGQLFAQVWHENILISEEEVFDFVDGEWVTITFDNFAIIDADNEYFVGYRIEVPVGTPAAYHDAGPRVEGKGMFIKTSGWIELPSTAYDFNFCIEGIIATETVASDETEIQSGGNHLGKNYPNPFSDETMINFSLNAENTGNAGIEIFNIKGQLVKQLEIANYELGVNQVIWNAKDQASGIYFYKLVVDGIPISTKKMILLK
ncbi:MAG: T9SS type A sorting domain-containing protein [Candidatus Cloacimonetes bacterium]|nr:T9SS type A sorting domain-containing protein [Candidatus Cloacimonadota bacterium]